MDNTMLIAFRAVVPLFVLISIGIVTRVKKILNEESLLHLNKLVFDVFFPINLFFNIYAIKLDKIVEPDFMLFTLAAILIAYVVTFLSVKYFVRDNKVCGAMIQCIYRSNFIIMGTSLVANVFGKDHLAIPALMITVVVPIYNILAVLTFEVFREDSKTLSVKNLILGIVKNPLIIGALIGVFFSLTGLGVPSVLKMALSQMSAAATPLALLALGASLQMGKIHHIKNLIFCVVGKLIIIPACVLPVAVYFGFRDVEFLTLIGIFTTPCAVSSFIMAQQMNSDAELTGNAVVLTSACSCVTIFGWIVLSRTLNLF